ncbi:hypothetical protein IPM62_05785 [Candidatus Woesebacteria bacterium]|nr:MAG: hypothetical protein IPM62_05785 [Candidatus Woesebacteria bacterium]
MTPENPFLKKMLRIYAQPTKPDEGSLEDLGDDDYVPKRFPPKSPLTGKQIRERDEERQRRVKQQNAARQQAQGD